MIAKEILTEWLADGDLERVIAGLRVVRKKLGDKDIAQAVDFQSSRYNSLQNSHLKGLIHHSDYSIELAKVRQALQQIIAGLPDDWDVEELKTVLATPSDRVAASHPVATPHEATFWKKLSYVAVIAGILGGFAEFFNFINLFPNWNSASMQLTVYVQDVDGKPVPELQNKGQIIVRFGHDLRDPVIGENGRTNLGEIPSDFQGKEVEVVLVAEGWELASTGKKHKMDGGQIYLTVRRDNSLGTIQGIVQTRDGSQFIPDALVMIDLDTTTHTDSLGRFRLVLPEKMHKESYLLIVKKEGYKDTRELYRPKTTPADIRLEK